MRVLILFVALLTLLYFTSAEYINHFDYEDYQKGKGYDAALEELSGVNSSGPASIMRARRSPPKFDPNSMKGKSKSKAKRSLHFSQYFEPAPALLSVMGSAGNSSI